MTIKQTKKEQLDIIKRKYEAKSLTLNTMNGFFRVPYLGINKNSYKSSFDTALHMALCSLSYISKSDTVDTGWINIDMIYTSMGYRPDSNTARTKESMHDTLDRFEADGIIKRTYMKDSSSSRSNKDDRMFFVSNFMPDDSSQFIRVAISDFMSMQTISKNTERIGIMSTYLGVMSYSFGYKAPKEPMKDDKGQFVKNEEGDIIQKDYFGPHVVARYKALSRPVVYASIDSMAQRVGMARNTFSKYLEKMIQYKLIASYRVQYDGYKSTQFKYVLARYRDAHLLRAYLEISVEERAVIARYTNFNYITKIFEE